MWCSLKCVKRYNWKSAAEGLAIFNGLFGQKPFLSFGRRFHYFDMLIEPYGPKPFLDHVTIVAYGKTSASGKGTLSDSRPLNKKLFATSKWTMCTIVATANDSSSNAIASSMRIC